MKLKKGILLMLCIGFTNLYAQSSFLPAGSNASGTGGKASYSVGLTVYTTNAGANGLAEQGIQQAIEFSVISSIQEAIYINLSILAYPNPTSESLILKIEDYPIKNVSCALYDVEGKILLNKEIENTVTNIDINSFNAGVYFLKITDNKKEIKSFKIIKN